MGTRTSPNEHLIAFIGQNFLRVVLAVAEELVGVKCRGI